LFVTTSALAVGECVRAAFCEMKRIARRDSIIWLGEIPEIDEYAYYGIYRGFSMLGF